PDAPPATPVPYPTRVRSRRGPRRNARMAVAATSLQPAYLRLGADEIARRADEARRLLGTDRCRVCPRFCKVDRLSDVAGLCKIRSEEHTSELQSRENLVC